MKENGGKRDSVLVSEQMYVRPAMECKMEKALSQRAQEPTSCTSLASLLKYFGKTRSLSDGRRLHAQMNEFGYDRDTFFGNYLVEMYGKCGSISDARSVFDHLPSPNLYSCNILINSYVQNGCMIGASGVFSGMPNRNVVSWNAMIAGFTQNGHAEEALHLFGQMLHEGVLPNKVTFICALNACASLAALEKGLEINAAIVDVGYELDIVVGTALVTMYGKCKSPCNARSVFDKISYQEVISCTAMITAFSQNGLGKEALHLFCQMQHKGITPNKITFVSALDACGILTAFEEGQDIHSAIVSFGHEGEVALANSLINMYCKCGNVLEAGNVFQKMPRHDVLSWTAMIAACSQNGFGKEALELFHQMQLQGINPDKITFAGALDACATLAALEKGREIHFSILNRGNDQDLMVSNALVNTYGKCGSIHDASNLFSRMIELDLFSWTAMILACAQQGLYEQAFDLFHQMQLAGIKPDKLTFTCVLTACSHTGRVADGMDLFVAMSSDYGIKQSEDHYVCIVDLLGRAGILDKAESLINTSLSAVPLAWLNMLGACRFHGDVDRAERAALHCMQLDPKIAAPYIILSNTYASAVSWNDVANQDWW